MPRTTLDTGEKYKSDLTSILEELKIEKTSKQKIII